MKSIRFRRIVARLLVTLAYFGCMFEWLWAFVVGLPLLLKSGMLDFLSSPSQPRPVVTAAAEPSPLVWVFIVVVMIGLFAMTIIALLRLPKTVSRVGRKIVSQTTNAAIPLVTHHQAIPAKKRVQLTRRIALAIQLVLSLLPLIPCWLLPPPEGLTRDVMLTTAACLSGFSFACFSLAWLIMPVKKSISRTRSHAFHG